MCSYTSRGQLLRYIESTLPFAEKALISRIRSTAKSAAKKKTGVATGIGDDCAVLRIPPGHEALVTTDFSLEGIHFRREWHPAESVGHRCLTRGLSDIAAMGGTPIAVFLSLAVPRNLPQKWIDGFTRGLLALADHFSVTLAGGDTAQSPNGILADIVVLGSVPKGKAVLRSRARPGDLIYVSGELGGSAAALHCMMDKPKRKLNPRDFPRHFFPQPRLALGRILREKSLASSMIDLSDGLSTDLAHLCDESGVGAEIETAAIPIATIGRPPRKVDLPTALHGGEDYELLFTAPRNKHLPAHIAGVPITPIGHITQSKKVVLLDEKRMRRALQPQGWQHLAP
jgi:thiamine-monophosphate kinase